VSAPLTYAQLCAAARSLVADTISVLVEVSTWQHGLSAWRDEFESETEWKISLVPGLDCRCSAFTSASAAGVLEALRRGLEEHATTKASAAIAAAPIDDLEIGRASL
jgi:hypothetical protein